MGGLDRKGVIVTGGAKGIGRAITQGFAGAGAQVLCVDVDTAAGEEVAASIEREGHLPGVPTAAEIETEGLAVGDITTTQQEKIEEIYLHLILLNEEVQDLKAENQQLKAEIAELKADK